MPILHRRYCIHDTTFPKIIPHGRQVMAGEEEISYFFSPEYSAMLKKEKTTVVDHYAEDMGTVPMFEVPTAEILKSLEGYYAFYQKWDEKRRL
jgi:hypothetical protein